MSSITFFSIGFHWISFCELWQSPPFSHPGTIQADLESAEYWNGQWRALPRAPFWVFHGHFAGPICAERLCSKPIQSLDRKTDWCLYPQPSGFSGGNHLRFQEWSAVDQHFLQEIVVLCYGAGPKPALNQSHPSQIPQVVNHFLTT